MKPSPGGQIAPNEVVGRDRLIQRLWKILERQSLVLTAERRMGKTTIIKKMVAEPLATKQVVFRDLEYIHTPLEFVDSVFQDVQNHLSRKVRTVTKVRKFVEQIEGSEFQGLKLPNVAAQHWKTILFKTIEDLMEQQEDSTLIFFWDEMPMMLDNIQKHSGDAVAMEILSALRSLRQTHSALRMVFTGSIGLHHVITQLKQAGYANSPTNDMPPEDVPPLKRSDAIDLARRLIEGAEIADGIFSEELAKAVANAVDCVPYYIHHVVDELNELHQEQRNITIDIIREIVDNNLCNPSNRWDMAHYRERLDTYYSAIDCPLALTILDELASTTEMLTFQKLFERLQLQRSRQDEEIIRRLLTLLQRDHYIALSKEGHYRFRYSLIQQYWRLSRGV
jgi:hypothetical protein